MSNSHCNLWRVIGTRFLATASLCTLLVTAAQAQYWNWTWMKGSSAINQNGVYGTILNEGSTNTPGARRYAASWTDNSDNLWVFGGDGYPASGANARLNDLWKYDTSTDNWTWMKGSDALNQWGTYGTILNESISNTPGARQFSVSWADSNGDLWLFGGAGWNSSGSNGYLNDLWKYDVSTGNWAWMKGSQSIGQQGTSGTIEVENSANNPSARGYAVGWTDSEDNLWLFGGNGYYPAGSGTGKLNDLWKFNTTSGNWTWMKGSNDRNQTATYGIKGVVADSNTPGGRQAPVAWTDSSGDLWLFGGMATTHPVRLVT